MLPIAKPIHIAALASVVLCMIAPTAMAQESTEPVEPAYVISDGIGTVYLPPTHVSFWLHYRLPEGDLEKNSSWPGRRRET